ncbi:hypothetical protein ACJX0J_025782, partial [Zea mays]
ITFFFQRNDMNREALTTRRKNGNEIKIIPRDHINKLLKNYILIPLYTNSSSSTSTSVISTSTSAISTSTSASTNRIYNSDNKCGLSKTLMTEQNNSAKQINSAQDDRTLSAKVLGRAGVFLFMFYELCNLYLWFTLYLLNYVIMCIYFNKTTCLCCLKTDDKAINLT